MYNDMSTIKAINEHVKNNWGNIVAYKGAGVRGIKGNACLFANICECLPY